MFVLELAEVTTGQAIFKEKASMKILMKILMKITTFLEKLWLKLIVIGWKFQTNLSVFFSILHDDSSTKYQHVR